MINRLKLLIWTVFLVGTVNVSVQLSFAGASSADIPRKSKWLKYLKAGERASELNRLPMAERFLSAATNEAKKGGESDFRMISALKALALVQMKQQKYEMAEVNLKKAIVLLEAKPEGPLLASCIFLLADDLSHDPSRFEESERLAERALLIWQRTLLRKRELTLKFLDTATLQACIGQFERSAATNQLALNCARQLGPQSLELQRACMAHAANGFNKLGGYYSQKRETRKAILAYLDAAKSYIDFGGAEQVNLIPVYAQLSKLYEELNDIGLELDIQKRRYVVLAKNLKPTDPELSACKTRLEALRSKLKSMQKDKTESIMYSNGGAS